MLSAGQLRRMAPRRPGHPGRAGKPARSRRGARTPGTSWSVPALLGMATPVWDFGARGALLGITGAPAARVRAGGPRGHRPSRRRPVRRRPSPTAASAWRPSGSTGACRPTRCSSRRWPTRSAGPSSSPVTRGDHPRGRLPGRDGRGRLEGRGRRGRRLASPAAVLEPTLDDRVRIARRERWLEARSRAGGPSPSSRPSSSDRRLGSARRSAEARSALTTPHAARLALLFVAPSADEQLVAPPRAWSTTPAGRPPGARSRPIGGR